MLGQLALKFCAIRVEHLQDVNFSVPDPLPEPKTLKKPSSFNVVNITAAADGHETP